MRERSAAIHGGPAFARAQGYAGDSDAQRGMTLRDYFAGQALAAMAKLLPEVWNEYDAARIAYVIADAMLAERTKAEGKEP